MNHSTDVARSGARSDLQRPSSTPAPHAGNGHVRELQDGERNRLLRGLPAAAFEQLAPHLEPVELAARQVLWEPDELIRAVFEIDVSQGHVAIVFDRGVIPLDRIAKTEVVEIERVGLVVEPVQRHLDAVVQP